MNIQLNPKCSVCKCYFIPIIKSSGQPYKCCLKCREREKENNEKNKCEHNRQRSRCKDCGGCSICEHNRIRDRCKDCRGSQICEHNRRRDRCKDCRGSQICEHNRLRYRCKDCGGSSVCLHKRRKNECKDCNFKLYLVQLQRNQINRCFKSSTLDKNKHSIEYLGCDIDTFINHFNKKIEYFHQFIATDELMTFDNIHIDHIKPVSKFDLDNEDEFLNCCNYTNLQPLLAKDNMEKSNRWNETNETYWKENIINKEYFEIYVIS